MYSKLISKKGKNNILPSSVLSGINRAPLSLSAVRRSLVKIVLYLVMLGLSFAFFYPFLYMIVNSLKTSDDLYNFTVQWVPRSLDFDNYRMAISITDYWRKLYNNTFVTVIATFGQLISCSMAGYALARYRFPGRRLAYFFMILALIVPVSTVIVPQYITFANLGWLNTYMPLIIPSFFGYGFKGAMFVFIFRQFYLGLPKELEEAGKIDGCGFIKLFTSIIFPVSRSSYLVVAVLGMVWHWNDYFEPSMYITERAKTLFSSAILNISAALSLPEGSLESSTGVSGGGIDNAVLFAGAFLIVLPILIAFCFMQKGFIQGIERSGLTGE